MSVKYLMFYRFFEILIYLEVVGPTERLSAEVALVVANRAVFRHNVSIKRLFCSESMTQIKQLDVCINLIFYSFF